jgi:predicted NAD/FAD-binding protein
LQVLSFPVQMLVRFWVNHHLLDLFQRPCWRVVKGRSKQYVSRVAAGAVEAGRLLVPEWLAMQVLGCACGTAASL